jgi:hypothetical protein
VLAHAEKPTTAEVELVLIAAVLSTATAAAVLPTTAAASSAGALMQHVIKRAGALLIYSSPGKEESQGKAPWGILKASCLYTAAKQQLGLAWI